MRDPHTKTTYGAHLPALRARCRCSASGWRALLQPVGTATTFSPAGPVRALLVESLPRWEGGHRARVPLPHFCTSVAVPAGGTAALVIGLDRAVPLSPGYASQPYWWDGVDFPDESPDPPPAEADIVVVGAGYTGLATAFEAARRGRAVVVFDRDDAVRGASSRSGGMVLPGLKHDLTAILAMENGRALWDETVTALEGLARLIDEHQVECDWMRTGHVELAHHPPRHAVSRKSPARSDRSARTPGSSKRTNSASRSGRTGFVARSSSSAARRSTRRNGRPRSNRWRWPRARPSSAAARCTGSR